jgi:hypothetical protein
MAMERKLLEGMMRVANTPDAQPADKILEQKLNEAATLKLDPIQTYVANGIVKWAVAQPKVKAASEKEGSLVNWVNMGNQVLRLTEPAAAEGKSVSLDGVEAATLITLLDWASKSPDIIQQSENAVINYAGVAQSIIQAAKGTKVQPKPLAAVAPAEKPVEEPVKEPEPAAEKSAAEHNPDDENELQRRTEAKKVSDRRQDLAEKLYIIKFLKEQKRELTQKEKTFISETEKVELTDTERAEVMKVFETTGKKKIKESAIWDFTQYDLKTLLKARDAYNVLNELGFAQDDDMMMELQAEIEEKSGGRKDEAAY